MSERGFPLSPAWWRQLGQENRALQMEANLRALVTNHGRGKRKALSQATFPVDCILGEKAHQGDTLYLVRWEGYHPSWEAWRTPDFSGQPGDPVETWEPSALVKYTQALRDWKARA